MSNKKPERERNLQSNCVLWFNNELPELRGRLFATFQESNDKVKGAVKNSLGLIRGVPDLIFIDDNKKIIGIELKHPNSSHNIKHLLEQADWMINNTHKGYFCDNIEMFKEIINGGKGIDPQRVYDYLFKKIGKQSNISWGKLVCDI